MRKSLFFLLFALSCLAGSRATAQVYARGSFDSWGTDYTMLSSGSLLTSRCVYMPAGEVDMKFANSDYSLAWGGGAGTSGTVSTSLSGNTVFTVTASAYYDVVFDSTALTYTVTQLPYAGANNEMYISGDFNGWSTNDRMVLVGNHMWQTQNRVAIAAGGHSGKFRNTTDWSGTDWGGTTGLSGTLVVTSGGGANITLSMAVTDSFTITFNDSSLAYSFVGSIPSAPGLSGPVIETIPATVYDTATTITVHYHPYNDTTGGSAAFENADSIYVYTYLGTMPSSSLSHEAVGWGSVSSTPSLLLTKIDSNDYVWTITDPTSFYHLSGDTVMNYVDAIFRNAAGTVQTEGFGFSVSHPASVFSGPIIETIPSSVYDTATTIVVHYHPYNDATGGSNAFKNADSVYVYTYLGTLPSSPLSHEAVGWGSVSSTPSLMLTKVDSNDYVWTITDPETFYHLTGDTVMDYVNAIFRNAAGTVQTEGFGFSVSHPASVFSGPIIETTPSPVYDFATSVVVHYHPYNDATGGSNAFKNADSVYVYTYLGTLPSSPLSHEAVGWGSVSSTPSLMLTKVDSNDYVWTITDPETFYHLTGDTVMDYVNAIFRNAAGTVQTEGFGFPVLHPSIEPSGVVINTIPAPVYDTNTTIIVHYHPYNDTTGGSTAFQNADSIYVYTYLGTLPSSPLSHEAVGWGSVSSTPSLLLTKVDSNDYIWTITAPASFYHLTGDTVMDYVNAIFRNAAGTVQTEGFGFPVLHPVPAVGPVVNTVPAPIYDTASSIVIHFHPYNDTTGGSNAFQGVDSIWVYTYLNSTLPHSPLSHEAVGWGSVSSTPALLATKIDSNDFVWTFADPATFYHLIADTTMDSIALIFRNGSGTVQTEGFYVPVLHPAAPPAGALITTVPSPIIDTCTSIAIHYHPYYDPTNGGPGNTSVPFENYPDTMYVYTWLHTTLPLSPLSHEAVGWGAVSSTPSQMVVKIDSNDFVWTITDPTTLYHLTADTTMDSIAVIFRNAAGTVQTENIYIPVQHLSPFAGPIITTNPSPVIDSNTTITFHFHPYNDSTGGSTPLRNYADSMFVYTWLENTLPHSPLNHEAVSWGAVETTPACYVTKIDSNDFEWTVTDPTTFYHLIADTTMDTIALIFRSNVGAPQTENFYVPVMHATEGVLTINVNKLSMQLVPNPATNEVAAIISGATLGSTISVVNQIGQCVLLQNVTSQNGKTTLGLRELPAGLYFVELNSGSKKVVQSLIKQ